MLDAHYNAICTVSRMVAYVYDGSIPTTVSAIASFATESYLNIFIGDTPTTLNLTLVGDITEAVAFDADTRYARTTGSFNSVSSIYSDIGTTASTLQVQAVSYANDILEFPLEIETFHGMFMRRGQPVSYMPQGPIQRTEATIMKIGGAEMVENDVIEIDDGTKYTVAQVDEIVDITRKRVWRLGINRLRTENSRS